MLLHHGGAASRTWNDMMNSLDARSSGHDGWREGNIEQERAAGAAGKKDGCRCRGRALSLNQP